MDIEKYISLYGKDLTRLCMSLCQSRSDAEDLYQSTWEKAMRHFRRYNREKPFDKWLFAICVNTYKDMVKSPFHKRIIRFDKVEDLERTINSIPADENISREEILSLHNAISKLTADKRQVIALYYFKDYGTKEVAEILSIPEGTVKSRLNSARQDLRKELNHE